MLHFLFFTIPGPVPCGHWYYGRVILVQWVSVGWWLQLTVNILALLLQMVNFKWLTIFSIVVKHVLLV